MAAASTATRITDRATAEAHIGRVCTYNTADGVEYGRIKRVTPTQVILDRLQQTATGTFLPHPVPVCPSSRNSVGYTRDIRLVSAPDIPTAADYRLKPADIRADRCLGRRLYDEEHGKDRRWKPVVYREFQCENAPLSGSDLCSTCSRRKDAHDAAAEKDRKDLPWHARVTDPLMPWAHMLGTEWATLPAGAVWRGGPAPAWWPVAAAPVLLFNVPEDAAEPEPAPAVAAAAPAVLTEDACARVFWTNEWRIGADDCLMDLPLKSIQIFWRWLKNLTYNDGSVTKLNTPGANSRAEIIAQLRLWYPEMRPRGVRGFDRKEVAVPPLPVAATINVPEDAAEPEPAPRFDVPEDAAPSADAQRIAALEERLAAALALIHTLTATV